MESRVDVSPQTDRPVDDEALDIIDTATPLAYLLPRAAPSRGSALPRLARQHPHDDKQ